MAENPASVSVTVGKASRILVIGCIDVGKSTLVNSLLGKEVAEPGIESVRQYRGEIGGVPVLIYDTPGLGDLREGSDEEFLAKISEFLSVVDVIICCIKMSESRMNEAIIQMFKQYDKIGVDWGKTVFALNFANGLTPPSKLTKDPGFTMGAYFEKRLQEWSNEITQLLGEKHHVDQNIISMFEFNPATDDRNEKLPDGKEWFAPFIKSLLLKDGIAITVPINVPCFNTPLTQENSQLMPSNGGNNDDQQEQMNPCVWIRRAYHTVCDQCTVL